MALCSTDRKKYMPGNFSSLKAGPFWEKIPMQPLQLAMSASPWLIFVSPGSSVSPWEQHWRAVAPWLRGCLFLVRYFWAMPVTFVVSARVLCEFRPSSLRKQRLPCESPADEADYPGILTLHSASCTETAPDFGRWTTAHCYFCAGDSGFGRSIMFEICFTSACSGLFYFWNICIRFSRNSFLLLLK